MNTGKALVIAGLTTGATVGVIYLIKAAGTQSTGDKLMTEPKGVSFQGVDGGYINLDITMQFVNPTKRKLTIDFLFLDITIEGKQIAELKQSNLGLTVPKDDIKFHTFRIKSQVATMGLSAAILVGQIVGKVLAGNFDELPEEALIKGYIKVNNIRTDYEKSVSFTAENNE